MNRQIVIFLVVAGATALCSLAESSSMPTSQATMPIGGNLNSVQPLITAQPQQPTVIAPVQQTATANFQTTDGTQIIYNSSKELQAVLNGASSFDGAHYVHPDVAKYHEAMFKITALTAENAALTRSATSMQTIVKSSQNQIAEMGKKVESNNTLIKQLQAQTKPSAAMQRAQ